MFISTKFVINNIEREKEIVNMTRKNMEFLKKNRIRFTWPEKTVEEEYSIEKYRKYRKWIEKEWEQKEQGFTKRLLVFFNKPMKTQFTVEISNYGPLGFYNSDTNTVTININTHLDSALTIKHEMIHIMLELFIKKYRIKHRQKENIVNTILEILKNI